MYKTKYLIIILWLNFTIQSFAKGRPEYYHKHFAGFHYSGAYTTMLHPLKTYNIAQGGYGGLGFIYEYNRYNFLVQSGVTFSFNLKSVTAPNDSIIKKGIIDTQKDSYTHKFIFENRTDHSIANYIEIPILFGLKHYGFYFLGGIKVNILYESHSFMKSEVTTTGMYDRYIDEFHDMFNHALFRNKVINVVNKGIDYNLGFSAHLESGYNFSSYNYRNTGYGHHRGEEIVFRIAVFAEYMLPIESQIKHQNLDLYTIYDKSPINVDAINMNHLYYTFSNNTFFHNINAGIKFTFLFNTFTKPCQTCQKHYNPKYHRTKKKCANCEKQKASLQQKK